MTARLIGLAAALAMTLPQVAQADELAPGVVATASNSYVARDGTVIPATIGMQLRPGDRVITRGNGSASVTLPSGCVIPLGTSAMLPVSGASCAKPNTVAFDQGRTGYAGKSSAFEEHDKTWLYVTLGALALGGVLCAAVFCGGSDHHHHHQPVSP
jgi:hypothetical protein